LIKKPTFLGSAVSVLLLFSVISYAQTLVQQQDLKAQQSSQSAQSNQNPTNIEASTASESAKPGVAADESTSLSAPEHTSDRTAFSDEKVAAVAQMYTATAYSLRGRTASGRPVSRGLIAADPAVLPLGSRVRLEAGSFSGEYLVADTGGAVRGRRIDIWTPSTREAMKFGRRIIKLTVLSLGAKRQKANSNRLSQDKTADPGPAK
jgi:3D (Asp-Asp-Asp) domain-containing protein